MKQRLSQPKKYGKKSPVLDVVGWVLQVSGSAGLVAQVWPIVAPLVVLALPPNLNSVSIVVPGYVEGLQESRLWLSEFCIMRD
jgi:hypothetical protein